MRVLLFGRGTIATLYGTALREAGHDVDFFVRPGRAAEYGDSVRLDVVDARRRGREQRVRTTAPLRLREAIGPDDGYDVVIVSVAHHRLAAAAEFLAPRVGDATVLVFGNVWGDPLAAVAPLPADRVVFGFPQAGGGFDADGVLHGALLRTVLVEAGRDAIRDRAATVERMFSAAGFRIRGEHDMPGWLGLHVVSDAGMLSQAVSRGSLAALIGDRRALREALLTSRELLPVLVARGVDLRRHRAALLPYRLAAPVSAAMAVATARVPLARASLEAHTEADTAETRAVLGDVLDEARRHGIAVPRLEAAVRALG